MTKKESEAFKLTFNCFLTLAVLVVALWGVNRYKNFKGFSSPSSEAGTSNQSVPAFTIDCAPARIKLEGGGPGLVIKNCTFGHTFDGLLDAIEWWESKGDPNAVGDKILRKDMWAENGYIYSGLPIEGIESGTLVIEGDLVYEYQSVGAYQIHKVYVDDVNRIISWHRQQYLAEDRLTQFVAVPIHYDEIYQFTYADRWDRHKSRAMTYIYVQYYLDRYVASIDIRHDALLSPLEVVARIHNGGPDGWKKESTKPYWEKVKARMEAK